MTVPRLQANDKMLLVPKVSMGTSSLLLTFEGSRARVQVETYRAQCYYKGGNCARKVVDLTCSALLADKYNFLTTEKASFKFRILGHLGIVHQNVATPREPAPSLQPTAYPASSCSPPLTLHLHPTNSHPWGPQLCRWVPWFTSMDTDPGMESGPRQHWQEFGGSGILGGFRGSDIDRGGHIPLSPWTPQPTERDAAEKGLKAWSTEQKSSCPAALSKSLTVGCGWLKPQEKCDSESALSSVC